MYDCKLGENNKNETSNARVELSRNVEEEPSAAAVGGGIKSRKLCEQLHVIYPFFCWALHAELMVWLLAQANDSA